MCLSPPTLPRVSIVCNVIAKFVVDLTVNGTLHVNKRPIRTNNNTAISAKYYHSVTSSNAFFLLQCWLDINPHRLAYFEHSAFFGFHRGSCFSVPFVG